MTTPTIPFGSQIDTGKIPVKGLAAEASATAPAGPVVGQQWTDTSLTPSVLKVWDGSAWTPANRYPGTTTGTYAAGDDTRITGAAQKASNLSDLANAGTSRDNLGLGTAAVANTGTGAANVILGNDSRLTDNRVPTDGSVTGGIAGAGVKIAAATITDANIASGNKDGLAATPSLRTLGTGAAQALAGNTRLDQLTAPTGPVGLNGQRLANVAEPTVDSDAATRGYVSTAIAGVGGLDTEGVQDIVGDMVTTNTETGITVDYDDVGAKLNFSVTDSPTVGGATPAQLRDRATHTGTQTASTISDFDTAAVAAANAGVIDADTLGGSTKAQVVNDAIAGITAGAPALLDTLDELAAAIGDDPNFASSIATALGLRNQTVASTVGDGVATSFTVTHNLASRDVTVQVYEAAGTYQQVWASVHRPTINTITVDFANAPTSGQYRVVVQGRAA